MAALGSTGSVGGSSCRFWEVPISAVVSRSCWRGWFLPAGIACALALQTGIAQAVEQSPVDPREPFTLKSETTASATESAKATGAKRGGGQRLELFQCREAPGGRCGTLRVPFDRSDPSAGTIPIFFEYYRPRDGGPTNQAVATSGGGPGFSATQDPFFSDFVGDVLLGPALEDRAYLVVDQRGVGRSAAVNCRKLQAGTDRPYQAYKACGRSLGHGAQLYGSGDVALDLEAIRKALHIKKLNLYGGSYAAMDIQAYVTRFPGRVRSAVLDGPVSFPGYDPFFPEGVAAHDRAAQLICERSASCSLERDALDSLAWLAERLRDDPVEGVGFDAHGDPRDVVVDESFLMWFLLWTDAGGNIALSELGAAADALMAGDETPLLRLAAEHEGPFFAEEGRPREFSAGLTAARTCTDLPFPWDKQAPSAIRREQFADARDALPADSFAPYSVEGWLAPFPDGVFGPDPCVAWPAPEGEVAPPVPTGAEFPPGVPAMILSGDLDLDTPTAEAQVLADEWDGSEHIEIANAGHFSGISARFECSATLIQSFIQDLAPGDQSCAADEDAVSFPAVGRFARTAADARPATIKNAGIDESTVLDRRVATVTAATVTDSIRRAFLQDRPTKAKALRGGTFTPSFSASATLADLRNARFAEDVRVSGSVKYPNASEVINAHVDVDGPGTEDGTLHIKGVWFGFRSPTTDLRIRGTLDGRELSLLVPAS